jgi:hypothetical protein
MDQFTDAMITVPSWAAVEALLNADGNETEVLTQQADLLGHAKLSTPSARSCRSEDGSVCMN